MSDPGNASSLRAPRQLPGWATFSHRPAIDGVRAIAALLVVVFHADMPGFDNGFAGVDVFFVLSGFLITSLLVREMWSQRKVSLPNFYARRIRRLLPAALTVLVITAVIYELVASPLDVLDNRMSFVWAALYVSNWYFLAQSQDYFATDVSPSPVLHYWSLSVEEQFYIVWPLVAVALLIGLRKRPLWATGLVGVIAIAGAALAGAIAVTSPMTSYFATYARVYQLMIGACLALFILARERREEAGGPPARPESWQRIAGIGSIAALVVLLAVSTNLANLLNPFWIGLVSCLATVALLAGLEYGPSSVLAKGLASRVPRLLGRYSYSIYLWHWPVIVIAGIVGVLPVLWWLRVPFVLVLTIGLAALTWWLIEGPAMRVSLTTLRRRARVIGAGLAGAAVAALASILVMQVPASVTEVVAAARQQVAEDVAPVIPARPTASPSPGITEPARILLVGDSHAMMLIPAFEALAKEQGWQLATVTRTACPWPDIRVTDPETDAPLDCATDLRQPALKAAEEFDPDITVLVSGSVVIRNVLVAGATLAPNDPGWLEELERGSSAFLFAMAQHTRAIVVLDPIPRTDKDMLQCVVRGGDAQSCAAPGVPRPGEPELTGMWKRITDRPGLTPLDLDEFFCPGGTCPAIVNGIVTRRDLQHLTVDYVSAIVDDLDAELRRQGVNLEAGTIARASTPGSASTTRTPLPSQATAPGDDSASGAPQAAAGPSVND
jgi:peptidoglycan/LPS O-acetylase OafA/YrhL